MRRKMKPGLVLILLVTIMTAAVAAGPRRQSGQDTLKVNVDLVNVQFTVTDRHGRFVPGLTKQDFLVEEDGRRQEIRNFARENELPLTLAMLVDTSPSVRPIFDEEKNDSGTISGNDSKSQRSGSRDGFRSGGNARSGLH
jgi:hypothetical protein